MHVYMCLNVPKPYAFHLSNCTKKRHASETPNLLLFVVLNLPRGVNLHEIQYEHDIFFYNSISHLHNGRSINVMVLQVLLDCYEFSTFSVWPQRAYQLK